MRAIIAIALNDLRLLARDKAAVFFTLGFPVLFALFFTMAMRGMSGGGGAAMDIAVMDLDKSVPSAALVGDMQTDSSLKVVTPEGLEEGRALVRRGKVAALVIVPQGFGEQMGGLFAGQTMKLEAEVDPSRQAEAGLLTGKLNQLAFKQMSSAFTDPGQMDRAVENARKMLAGSVNEDTPQGKAFGGFYDSLGGLSRELSRIQAEEKGEPGVTAGGGGFSPVVVEIRSLSRGDKKEPATTSDIAFPQGMAWGLMSCVVGFASSFAAERRRGTLVRLTTSPLSRATLLGGKVLGGFVACVVVMGLLIVGAMVMGTRVANWPFLVAIVLCAAAGFVGFSLALAAFARTEEGAGGIGRAVPMVLAMIGGGTIPLAFMPETFRRVSDISPFKWAIYGVEGAIWRGLTPGEFVLPCGILLGLGLVSFAVGVRRLSWTD